VLIPTIPLTEAAKQGGHIVLHYLGAGELSDAQDVAKQVEAMGRKIVLVPGDISLPQTAEKVRRHRRPMIKVPLANHLHFLPT
jgi:hypothetical protein